MHEGTLVRELVEKIQEIARTNGAKSVSRVRVTLGGLAHCSPEHFREHFIEESRGTVAANAVLDVQVLPEDLNDPNAQEIVLESVDVEE